MTLTWPSPAPTALAIATLGGAGRPDPPAAVPPDPPEELPQASSAIRLAAVTTARERVRYIGTSSAGGTSAVRNELGGIHVPCMVGLPDQADGAPEQGIEVGLRGRERGLRGDERRAGPDVDEQAQGRPEVDHL